MEAWTDAQVGGGLMLNRHVSGHTGWLSNRWDPNVSETLTPPLTALRPLHSLLYPP